MTTFFVLDLFFHRAYQDQNIFKLKIMRLKCFGEFFMDNNINLDQILV